MLALVHHRSKGSSASLGSCPQYDELITYKRLAGTRQFRLGTISFHSLTLSPSKAINFRVSCCSWEPRRV